MNIEKLFSGIAVIVDNEINNEASSIFNIKRLIEEKHIPVLAFSEIPSIDVIPSLSGVSFVILDWDYANVAYDTEDDERIAIPSTLAESEETRIIDFIHQLIEKLFIPIFIFTAQSKEMIIEKLKDSDLLSDKQPDRIFVKQKDEVNTNEALFSAIAEWTKEMPSVYVLKKWALTIQEAQNSMFNELYSYSPNWTKVIWDMLKDDSIDNQQEFGAFVTRSLLNRIDAYSFEEEALKSEHPLNTDEIRKIVERERYLKYKTQPEQAYTGDLFKEGHCYYLNIRAQCSIARKDQQGIYDPMLYCIKGKKMKDKEIKAKEIHITSEKQLVFSSTKQYALDEICKICEDENKLGELNSNFKKHSNSVSFRKGMILERDDKVIIGCVDNEQAIVFNMDIELIKFSTMKDKRIGRILPPYITRIQQKTAMNMVREGIPPLPEELYT